MRQGSDFNTQKTKQKKNNTKPFSTVSIHNVDRTVVSSMRPFIEPRFPTVFESSTNGNTVAAPLRSESSESCTRTAYVEPHGYRKVNRQKIIQLPLS